MFLINCINNLSYFNYYFFYLFFCSSKNPEKQLKRENVKPICYHCCLSNGNFISVFENPSALSLDILSEIKDLSHDFCIGHNILGLGILI